MLLQGLAKFRSQQNQLDLTILSEPIMQLLYVSNRTDRAMEIFMAKVGIFFCRAF
jgi:hypothetical protein